MMRETKEMRRARREEVTVEEKTGTSLPPAEPLGTYFTPDNPSPLSMPALPIMFLGGKSPISAICQDHIERKGSALMSLLF